MALDATPGGAAADSYATVADLTAYLDAHVSGAAASAKTTDEKERALKTATRQLDSFLAWAGAPASQTQALAVPRVGLVDPNTLAPIAATVVPTRVKWATCEQARLLLVVGDRAVDGDVEREGLASLKAGSVELEFRDKAPQAVVAPSAYAFVAAWAVPVGQVGLGGTISLARR